MIRKVIFVVLLIVAAIILWATFKTFLGSSINTTNPFYQTPFLSVISDAITGPLGLVDKNSPAQVNLEELGEFSPLVGMVKIVKNISTVAMDDTFYEYIEIRANKNNAQPINISDWSLQSMISDVWISMPQGSNLYVAGEVNVLKDIYLRPGESAIIATRQSPVGVSFRTNKCSGFLSSTQKFEPTLKSLCINPKDVVLPTINNLKEYGGECVSFVENFDRCEYVTNKTRGFSSISKKCRDYIQPQLTYNFCSNKYEKDSDFYNAKEWRIFLNQDTTLWHKNYEIIRLLDTDYKTVDVFNY